MSRGSGSLTPLQPEKILLLQYISCILFKFQVLSPASRHLSFDDVQTHLGSTNGPLLARFALFSLLVVIPQAEPVLSATYSGEVSSAYFFPPSSWCDLST